MRIGGSIYRAALGFQANGWTEGDPWHSCPRARDPSGWEGGGDSHGAARRPAPRRASCRSREGRQGGKRRDGERADRWAPHGSETRRWVGVRRAGLLKWAERPGGLRSV
jgi:hypothetical protein